uniref:Uncharacterized protein n=1 Tax=Apteryx owenii TaxID=8824 RepID=A0A8B9NPN2_APTOW
MLRLLFAASQLCATLTGIMTQFCSAALVQLLWTMIVLFKVTLSVEHAPMLLWSTWRSQWHPDTTLHEGHIVSTQELAVLLQPVFNQNSKNLILFVQDTVCNINSFYLTNVECKSVCK